MPDTQQPQPEGNVDDEIDEESASVLPNREAMSVIDPSFVTRIIPGATQPTPPHDTAEPTTGQGIDESDPSTSA